MVGTVLPILFFLNYLHGSEQYNIEVDADTVFLNYLNGSELEDDRSLSFGIFLNYLHGSERTNNWKDGVR